MFFDESLNNEQQAIVARNAKLFLDRQQWSEKVARFETELNKIEPEKARGVRRRTYAIRFDYYLFEANGRVHDFSHRHFPCSVSFNGTNFGDGEVSFNNATFGDGHVWFNDATFGDGEVSFNDATFNDGNVSFDDATFGDGEVSFDGTTFSDGNVSFEDANFGDGHVWFNDATFGDGHVWFNSATFGDGNVYFTPKQLKANSVSFQDTEVAGNLFVQADFPKWAIFQRLNVAGSARFFGCTFAEIPDFRDAKFDRPPEVARMVVPPPELTGRRGIFRTCKDEEAVAKYRKLKAMAIDAHDHEMDGGFFAFEMMAKRGTETGGFFPLLFNSLYGLLSSYGQSFLRPMGGLLASWLGFGIVYFGLAGSVLPLLDRFLFAAEYSVRSAIPLLNSLFRFSVSPSPSYQSAFEKQFGAVESALENIDWFTYLAIIQQFIGLVLLFLLLLALRNTFRLK